MIRNQSLLLEPDTSDDDSYGSAYESGDDVALETGSSSSENDDLEILGPEMKKLNITYDDQFLEHESQNTDDPEVTQLECVDMEISSALPDPIIECNVPVQLHDELQMFDPDDDAGQETLLSDNYFKMLSENLDDDLLEEKKFICSHSKIAELFSFCRDRECNMSLEVKERYVGCVLEIRWRCKMGHVGEWQSSESVNRVYVNNIQCAAALLFSGNHFAKLSLFAKCLHLAFFSATTFYLYQKNYLATPVNSWWYDMQAEMFKNLGDRPVVIAGDGQMDSPGYSAKNCIYTMMHAELDYVLHVELVDVRHSQLKSAVMEKVGCQRALDFLMDKIKVVELVTDASSQIIKMLGNIYILYFT